MSYLVVYFSLGCLGHLAPATSLVTHQTYPGSSSCASHVSFLPASSELLRGAHPECEFKINNRASAAEQPFPEGILCIPRTVKMNMIFFARAKSR